MRLNHVLSNDTLEEVSIAYEEVYMETQRQGEWIKLLTEKGAIQPCPRCTNPQFELIGEAFLEMIIEKPSGFSPSNILPIPVIVVACKRCGYITQHAQRVLDPDAELRF